MLQEDHTTLLDLLLPSDLLLVSHSTFTTVCTRHHLLYFLFPHPNPFLPVASSHSCSTFCSVSPPPGSLPRFASITSISSSSLLSLFPQHYGFQDRVVLWTQFMASFSLYPQHIQPVINKGLNKGLFQGMCKAYVGGS